MPLLLIHFDYFLQQNVRLFWVILTPTLESDIIYAHSNTYFNLIFISFYRGSTMGLGGARLQENLYPVKALPKPDYCRRERL